MLQCKVMKSMYIYMLHCGDDNNNGTIDNPVKTIKRATEILESKTTEAKEKIIVIISNLDLNTQEYLSGSSITPVVTSNDGYNDFQRYIELKDSTNNIGQNLIFKNIQLKSIYGEKNIFANGYNLTIDEGVETNVDDAKYKINIYGGSYTDNIGSGNNINVEINSGRWSYIYGGNYSGFVNGTIVRDEKTGSIIGSTTGSMINVTINGGKFNCVYGGGNSSRITARKINVTINGGTINSVFGGSYVSSSSIYKSVIEVNIIGGEILGYKTYNQEGKEQQNEGYVCGASRTGKIYGITTEVNIGSKEDTQNGPKVMYVLGGSIGSVIENKIPQGEDVINVTNVNIYGGTVESGIYGGNMNASASLKGNTNVNIIGGKVNGVIGGSYAGYLEGNTNVKVTGGSSVYCYAGSSRGEIKGNTNLEVTGGSISSIAYGGSKIGNITGNTNIEIIEVKDHINITSILQKPK